MYLLLPIILHYCCRLSCTIVANYCVFLIAIFSVFLFTDYIHFMRTGQMLNLKLTFRFYENIFAPPAHFFYRH